MGEFFSGDGGGGGGKDVASDGKEASDRGAVEVLSGVAQQVDGAKLVDGVGEEAGKELAEAWELVGDD